MVFSKFQIIDTTCMEYVHPWSKSCIRAHIPLAVPCIIESFKLYSVGYALSLLLKGRVPTKRDVRNTLFGLMQSCIFLTFHGVGFSTTACLLRNIMGHYSFYTVSFLPSFLSSILAILIERPSRRALLSLYVTNVASETVFNMAVSRNLIKPIRYGEVLIFALSVGHLLYFYKGHVMPRDPVYLCLRFLIGPNEQKDFVKEELNDHETVKDRIRKLRKYYLGRYLENLFKWYHKKLEELKSLTSHPSCPHFHSCVHYSVSGGLDRFIKGYLIQFCFKSLLSIRKIFKKPSLLLEIALRKEALGLGLFCGTFTAVFRALSCALRRALDRDSPFSAIPAGIVAGLSFYLFRDNTIALYFMWKTFQLCYNLASEKGYAPEIPWAPVILHAFSTAILFHVAIYEPTNLRPSYWTFLQNMSGGRISLMGREGIDAFGLESSKKLALVLTRFSK